MATQTVLILDFGGQYKELIARRVRECKVFSIVKAGDITPEEIKEINPIGIILTGGPNSVYKEDSPHCDKRIFELGIPVLGICYGNQLLAWSVGGEVSPCAVSEYGKTKMKVNTFSPLFEGLKSEQIGLMSHTDQVTVLPKGFVSVATTGHCVNAAIENRERNLYGMQFHPEVESTPDGIRMIHNFLYNVCGATGDYSLRNLEGKLIEQVRQQVGDSEVLLGLSGGVDSSVCAALLSKAIPGKLHCIFVDHGLMRKNEGDEVEEAFRGRDLDFIRVNAEEQFLAALKGVTDPEEKRKIIGAEFVKVFEEVRAKQLPDVKFLAQGTIYPDVIESLSITGMTIKSHHNVGGLPEKMNLKLVEPLRLLFKDEVRRVGRELGISEKLIGRHPFPGPGLAVRILGDITPEKVHILQEADHIFIQGLIDNDLYNKVWQAGVVLLPVQSVGVMGDERTYERAVALRAVLSTDGMTADWAHLPYEFLAKVSNDIINKVRGVNRVVYDISSKPPSTIEWE